MTELMQIYKCNVCGNIVEIINPGAGELVCCNVPMEHLEEKSSDDNFMEKHVPVMTMEGTHKIIRVGTIPHPMEKEHYIMFIEAVSPDKKYLKRKYLTPSDKPEAEVCGECNYDNYSSRELCNIHGLWSTKFQ